MRTHPLLLTLALFSMNSAACMTSVEVKADNIEVTWRGLSFDAAQTSASEAISSTEGSFELDIASLSWAKDLDAKARVKQVRIVPAEGVQDLGFLEFATTTMAATSNPENAMAIATYQRLTAAALEPKLEITNSQPVDVAEIWAAKQVRVGVVLLGQLPTVPWSVDVTVVLDGEITVGP